MLRLAVTGGIACGKSLVGSFLQAEGVPVCDADDLAHELMEPGNPIYDEVVRVFGKDVLSQDGTINRSVLAATVFSDKEKLDRLNSIVHPSVRERWEAWLESQPVATRAAAVIIPLLFETGEHGSGWDSIVCVGASRKDQLERLRDRGLSDDEADVRISSQGSMQEKMKRSDCVLFNGSSVDALKNQTLMMLRALLES